MSATAVGPWEVLWLSPVDSLALRMTKEKNRVADSIKGHAMK